MNFKVNDLNVGEKGSELRLAAPDAVHATAHVAALLPEQPARYDKNGPYWNIERARIGQSREVPIEVVVNGVPVARKTIVADGNQQDIAFDVHIERSSWVALRILGASHTNPVFVVVGDKPIRASRRSADWCLKCVDQCWKQKRQFIKAEEMQDAEQAYEHARQSYRQILSECDID